MEITTVGFMTKEYPGKNDSKISYYGLTRTKRVQIIIAVRLFRLKIG